MLMEKEIIIEKLKTELNQLKLNNRLANSIIESPTHYTNINDVTAKRMQGISICSTSKISKFSDITPPVEQLPIQLPIKSTGIQPHANTAQKPKFLNKKPEFVNPKPEIQRKIDFSKPEGDLDVSGNSEINKVQDNKKPRKRVVLQLKDLF